MFSCRAHQILVQGVAEDDWSGANALPEMGTWRFLEDGGWVWELEELGVDETARFALLLDGRALGDWSYRVEVNGAPIPRNATSGWTYDGGTRSIQFLGNYVPPPGAEVRVRYDLAI